MLQIEISLARFIFCTVPLKCDYRRNRNTNWINDDEPLFRIYPLVSFRISSNVENLDFDFNESIAVLFFLYLGELNNWNRLKKFAKND